MRPFKQKGGKSKEIQAMSKKADQKQAEFYEKADKVIERLENDTDISILILHSIRKSDGK